MQKLKLELKNRMSAWKEHGKKFTVVWNAGGDQTPIGYSLNGEYIKDRYDDPFYEKLSMLLIELFSLPNAGEYYNVGSGTFVFKEEEPFLEYSEFAYYDDYDSNLELNFKEMVFEHKLPIPFDVFKKGKISFYGIQAYQNKLSTEFHCYELNDHLSKEALLELQKTIEQRVLMQLTSLNKKHLELEYNGEVKQKTIIISSLNGFKYNIDKQKTHSTIKLFQ